MWPYTSPVMLIELWPNKSAMALIWTPDSNHATAAEWRSSERLEQVDVLAKAAHQLMTVLGQGVTAGEMECSAVCRRAVDGV